MVRLQPVFAQWGSPCDALTELYLAFISLRALFTRAYGWLMIQRAVFFAASRMRYHLRSVVLVGRWSTWRGCWS